MFYTLSPSKPHKNRAQIHPRTPQNSIFISGQTMLKCKKMSRKNEERERERERDYLRGRRRSTGKRGEEERRSGCEREMREREKFGGQMKKKAEEEEGN